MVYGTAVDGAFCKFCALFCDCRHKKGQFVNEPFRGWNKINEKVKEHEKCSYHQASLKAAEDFIERVEFPETCVYNHLDKMHSENIARNRAILKCIIEAILFCAKQCIALRSDTESLEASKNPGNFLSLTKLMTKHNETLQKHLESTAVMNATYASPHTQNELLEIMGGHIVLQDIVNEINHAKCYSIMADEVTSHNVEHLAICARFVDAENNIREEFLTFVKLERTTGAYVADQVMKFLNSVGLPLEHLRGQSYDGASSMSSERVELQARIETEVPFSCVHSL